MKVRIVSGSGSHIVLRAVFFLKRLLKSRLRA